MSANPLNMLTKVLLLLALSGLSWSRLPVRRRCDPEERRDTPTLCSNYRNILHLDGIQTELVEKQEQLQQRMDAVDMQVHSANISSLQRLVTNLSLALKDAENRKSQTEMETQLERQEEDITSLKRLVQHGDRLSETEQRLHRTETQLKHLETGTQRILNLYNATATQLEAEVEARLVAMETRLQARLVAMETRLQAEVQKIQNNSEGIKHRLKSTEESVAEQSGLRLEVNGLKAEVDTKVAFSAAIIESGPDRTSSVLIFTNIGNAYSRKTGVFTAPLNGVYHFTFTTSGDNSFTPRGVLVKNGRYRIRTWERTGPDISDSNTVILHLNARDTINVVLWDGGRIRTSVFSGFLVFTTS